MITIKLLPTGVYHARGIGPCNWAQWPRLESLRDEHFFTEACQSFRRELWLELELRGLPELEEPWPT